ncbi:hypothetical protein V491_02843 [Pseudogymnoascus sp. VKM F-3775]|nr:hypothetical protein V491_02843 [Pseudogymnoascus sp. VKM F-3775]
MSCQVLPLAAKAELVLYPAEAGNELQEEKMGQDIAGHGSKPLMRKAREEGIYASFMPTNMRLDQGLTLPPKIHPETLTDNGESRKAAVSKKKIINKTTLEAHDRHLIDKVSQRNARKDNAECTNEAQQEHTGKIYDQCQHIDSNALCRHKKLTDGPSSFPTLGQKQLGCGPSSGATDHASKLEKMKLEKMILQRMNSLARVQSAGCQGNIDEEAANQLQLALINGNIPNVWPGRAMSGSSGPSEDTLSQIDGPEAGGVHFLCDRESIIFIDQRLATKHLTALRTDDLPEGGIEDMGQELTVSLDSVERLSGSDSISLTPEIGNMFGGKDMVDGKATRNVSVPEQLKEEKSQDEKLQYEQPQGKIHTPGQIAVSMVERRTRMAGGVPCGVGSPKAEGVKARLYSPVYKPPKSSSSSQLNTTIPTTIRSIPAPKHISATRQHTSLSNLYSSQPQLLALRTYIATAPMASPGMEKVRQVIIAAIDGDIALERNPNFEAQLEVILHRMMVDDEFLRGVVAFTMSKLGYSITENDGSSPSQGTCLGANITASKAPGPKFNVKTCTFDELKEEYIASKTLARKEHKLLSQAVLKYSTLEKDIEQLKENRDFWKAIASSVPDSKAEINLSIKWHCTFCDLLNDTWADPTEWAAGKALKDARPGPEEAGIPASNTNTWTPTKYCRYCGRNKSGKQPEQNVESPRKRKMTVATEGASIQAFDGQFKRHCKHLQNELKTSGGAIPITQAYHFQSTDSPAEDPGSQLTQLLLANQNTVNTQQGQDNDSNASAQNLSNANDTVADQQRLPNIGGTIPHQQYSPNGDGTIGGQSCFPTGNDMATNKQYVSTDYGITSDQQRPPTSSGTITDQHLSRNLAGTNAGQHDLPSTDSSAISNQHSPGLTGIDADQECFPGTNQSSCGQLCTPSIQTIDTDPFIENGDLFNMTDYGAPPADSVAQSRMAMENWYARELSLKTGVLASIVLEAPNVSSLGETTFQSAPATPWSIGDSAEFPIEIGDDVSPISQADMEAINSIQNDFDGYIPPTPQTDLNVSQSISNEVSYQPAASAPAEPQTNTQSKPAKPSAKYDMRGNPIPTGLATLPTTRYPKPMAPRTAKLGVLMFPASAGAPKNAAPEPAQHPNSG